MPDFEKLGVFYLGREYDLATKQPGQDLLLYDSKDLVTHAVCVGMTGSGKTGLCIALIEEAAIDGVPAIIVDPKGDLGNLMLTFPELRTEDFRPWINEEDAQRKGLTPEDYAAKQAKLWSDGLAQWGQDGERIRRLRSSADFAIYTPGSSAGLPVSILKSFAAPSRAIAEDLELLGERVNATVTGLLGLLGIEADPLQSREHILLSTILTEAWKQQRDLDLPQFIQAIQSPPVARIGVFDVDSFYPSKDRFALAMRVNNLLAAPGFAAWLEGEPLDIDRMLFTADGKPRVSIFSIAHLNDAERMFFVSLLLTQLLGWMRSQPGTTSLRALFYMDEIFGYFPPVANPPSKAPLLTLVKQARAFGLGIVLSTQNPVDLDYKGLSNTGTWLIGRLQTERDKERVLDGLEGAAAGASGRFDRAKMGETLAGLGSRIFLMNNVHDDSPVVFESRWAMSYLRGPLTRTQIKQLTDPRRGAASAAAPRTATTAAAERVAPPSGPAQPAPTTPSQTTPSPPAPPAPPAPAMPAGAAAAAPAPTAASSRPMLPADIPQYFLAPGTGVAAAASPAGSAAGGARISYAPMLLGIGKLFYADAKLGITSQKEIARLAAFSEGASRVDWGSAQDIALAEGDLGASAAGEAAFGPLPKEAFNTRSYPVWSNAFKEWLYQNAALTLWRSPSTGIVSEPGEGEREFRIRLQQAGREKRDALVERLRQKYATRITSLEDRIRRAEQAVQREKEQAEQSKLQAAISLGATILSTLGGRRAISRSSLGRATTTARGAGRVMKEGQDVQRATASLQTLHAQLADLQTQLQTETAAIVGSSDALAETLARVEVRAKKADITIATLALAWVPRGEDMSALGAGVRP